jgi:hypothetical protein
MADDMIDGNDSVLAETLMSGADATGALTPPPAGNAGTIIDIMSRVGSQGAPVPSNALDAQQRTTDLSKVLAGYAKGLTANQGGYGDIASALAATVAGQGKTSYGQAMEGLQNQRITRAYNIANAMAGLGRQGAAGQLTERDVLNLLRDQTRDAATRGNQKAAQIQNFARGYMTQFGPEGEAIAYAAALEADRSMPNASPLEILSRASQIADERIRGQGLQPVRGATTGAVSGGVTKDERGMWVAPRGQRLPTDMGISNLERGRGNTKKADEIDLRLAERAAGAGRGANPVDRYGKALEGSEVALGLIERTRGILRENPQAAGAAGSIGMFVRGVEAQARALMNTPVELSTGGGKYQDVDAIVLSNPTAARAIWDRVTAGTELKTGFSWLDKAPEAQALRTNLLLLSFAVARAIEPGGRLSNQDVANVLNALGAGGANIFTDPRAMARALEEVEAYVKSATNATYRAAAQRSPDFAKSNPNEPYPMRPAAPAQPAAAPQAGSSPARLRYNPATGDLE